MPRRDKSKRTSALSRQTAARVPKARANRKGKKTPTQIENPTVGFRLSLAERAKLDNIAAARNISRNALLQEIVGEFLAKQQACKQGTK